MSTSSSPAAPPDLLTLAEVAKRLRVSRAVLLRYLVEAPGIEPDQTQTPDTIERQSSSIGVHGDPADVPDGASMCPIDRRDVTESSEGDELSDVVETALAKALALAAEARRWDVAMAIAEELRHRGEPSGDRLSRRRRRG